MVAVGVRDLVTDEFKYDPSIIRWEARIFTKDEFTSSVLRQRIGMHPCRSEEWDQFYDPNPKNEDKFSSLKQK